MEKYCPNCGRVLGKVDFKFCPYCQSELNERVGRKPIPGHLRHKVFVRDNYRCVECGATNMETTLEIDHIIPVSKGGTNDIDNLQTLCKECNRAKSATIWNVEYGSTFDSNSNLKAITAKMKEQRNRANPKPLLENLSEKEFSKLCHNLSIDNQSKTTKNINYLCENYDAYFLQKSIRQLKKDEKYFSKKLLENQNPLICYCLSKRLLGKEKYSKENLISELVNNFSYEELRKEVEISHENANFYDWIHSLDEDELYFLLRHFYLNPKNQSKESMIRMLTDNCSEKDILFVFELVDKNPSLKNDYKPINNENEFLNNLNDNEINRLFDNLADLKFKGNFSKQQKVNYLSSYDKKFLKKVLSAIKQ